MWYSSKFAAITSGSSRYITERSMQCLKRSAETFLLIYFCKYVIELESMFYNRNHYIKTNSSIGCGQGKLEKRRHFSCNKFGLDFQFILMSNFELCCSNACYRFSLLSFKFHSNFLFFFPDKHCWFVQQLQKLWSKKYNHKGNGQLQERRCNKRSGSLCKTVLVKNFPYVKKNSV